MIKAAKAFFGELLKAPRGKDAKRGGRRTDDEHVFVRDIALRSLSYVIAYGVQGY